MDTVQRWLLLADWQKGMSLWSACAERCTLQVNRRFQHDTWNARAQYCNALGSSITANCMSAAFNISQETDLFYALD